MSRAVNTARLRKRAIELTEKAAEAALTAGDHRAAALAASRLERLADSIDKRLREKRAARKPKPPEPEAPRKPKITI